MTYALLVDDDVALVNDIVAVVRDEGLELTAVHDWDEALSKFYGLGPVLVIADYDLPGSKHGLHLLVDLAKINPETKFILFSAYVNAADVDNIRKLGVVDDVLRKTDPVETARAVIAYVREAAQSASQDTKWGEFAKARKLRAVSEADLKALDDFMRGQVAKAHGADPT